jgi:catechol 2,3-dioxygenase-like lactoylglutathione lyase family enzyme
VTHFIIVADIDRSADFYEKVFGGRILSRGDSKGARRLRGKASRHGP